MAFKEPSAIPQDLLLIQEFVSSIENAVVLDPKSPADVRNVTVDSDASTAAESSEDELDEIEASLAVVKKEEDTMETIEKPYVTSFILRLQLITFGIVICL